MLLALGPSTPLYGPLYEWLPLFDRLRGTGKFIFFAALFGLFVGAVVRVVRKRMQEPDLEPERPEAGQS